MGECHRSHNLPVQLRLVRIDKGEHRQPWYLELNPLGKLPLLVDGDLKLPESPAILLYLADRYSTPWVPRWPGKAGAQQAGGEPPAVATASAAAARFHAALHWQGSALRAGAHGYVLNRVVGPVVGAPTSEAGAQLALAALKVALRDMERVWLRGGGFMAGGDDITVADVLAACELEQLRLLDADPLYGPTLDQLLSRTPGVTAWLQRVRIRVGLAWDEAHATLTAALAAMVKRRAAVPKL